MQLERGGFAQCQDCGRVFVLSTAPKTAVCTRCKGVRVGPWLARARAPVGLAAGLSS